MPAAAGRAPATTAPLAGLKSKGLDDQHFLQRFTPRRVRSIWSEINVDKVAGLIEAGRMQPAGSAPVDAAKSDGRWRQAYDDARTSSVPDDLQAALIAGANTSTMVL